MFSAKLERCETLGELSFRGVCSGVELVDEMAVELSDAGLWLGERVLPADDVGREELLCAAIGMFQPEEVTLCRASTPVAVGSDVRARGSRERQRQGWMMWLFGRTALRYARYCKTRRQPSHKPPQGPWLECELQRTLSPLN